MSGHRVILMQFVQGTHVGELALEAPNYGLTVYGTSEGSTIYAWLNLGGTTVQLQLFAEAIERLYGVTPLPPWGPKTVRWKRAKGMS